MAASETTGAEGADLGVLGALLKAELGAGVLGLRLFMACVAVAAFMLGTVWMVGTGLSGALERNGLRILGGDVSIEVRNTPLDDALVSRLRGLGTLSRVVEMRSSARTEGGRSPVELKAVDDAYPLYGAVRLDGADSLGAALSARDGRPGAVVERALLSRLGIAVGDAITLGRTEFEVRGVLRLEPDRLSSGSFLVGPRVIVDLARLEETGLTGQGSLSTWRYRLRAPEDAARADLASGVRRLRPERGWEVATPRDAGDRVRRTVARTTTFLGVAGIVALAIGLAGAWAAATNWVARRSRTIALYRLSGATPSLVVALHATIVAVAGLAGLVMGLGLALAAALALVDLVAAELHLEWGLSSLVGPALQVAATLILGLAGACTAALSSAARTAPGAAMRSGDVAFAPRARHVALGVVAIAAATVLAVGSLPVPLLGATAALGLVAAAAVLGLAGWGLARLAAWRQPRGFVGIVAARGLAEPGTAATKALAIGIGIAGITAILAAQSSLEQALRSELPAKVPDLVMIDVQPDQIGAIRERVAGDPDLGSLQTSPFMRATITRVNGKPAAEALVRRDKSWVIEGDRSFAWSAEPTGADLLAGEWWPADYEGEPLISAEEDVAEAFGLEPGDRLTYSVLGRTFTSQVANIRKEYHRTFRPEFLLVASPAPFRDAPHSWIVTLQGETGPAIDGLIRDVARMAPNVTSIDVRRIVAELREVVDGAVLGTLAVAATLLLAGALSLAAVVASDVDSRRREALAFTLVGASRREIALARLAEALAIGAIAALVGGLAGFAGGYWLVDEALHVAWAPGVAAFVVPVALGAVAALAAGIAGGLGALPRGRGRVAWELSN